MSHVRGVGRMRKMIRRIPDATQTEMGSALEVGGRAILAEMRRRTPRRTGALASGLSYQVLPKTLRLRVGLLGTKRGRSKLFYGRILDLGRKAQTVVVTRRRNTKAYKLRVRAMAGKRFVTGQYLNTRATLNRALKGVWGKVLSKVASGNG